jgi:hypothetical protein
MCVPVPAPEIAKNSGMDTHTSRATLLEKSHIVLFLGAYLPLCLSRRLRFLRLCLAILKRRFFFTEDIILT